MSASNLIVVESPAKAKTIKKYVGSGFQVLASYGHVRDLLPKKGAVDPENNFAMSYETIAKNSKHLSAIAKALKEATSLYLATDPDREGEAIAWHVCEVMKAKKLLSKKPVYRVVFHEVTKSAVQEAMKNPRSISMELVNAQQARRALDYLVGFNLSPLLWKKIKTGLSAGRVQSPALRLIVEREYEIENFTAQEYWTIVAKLNHERIPFSAKLFIYRDEKLTQFSITSSLQAQEIEKYLLESANNKLLVSKVEKKQRKKHPAPPFITSTLQQEAVRKLNFTAQKTMRAAQQLYEGITLGAESVGLITYMRTDSTNISQEALTEIREFISSHYGKSSLPESSVFYKTKTKNAQEAHEAIRPTSIYRTPESVKQYLNEEQLKLYELIWKRALSCQMIPAILDVVTIDLKCGDNSYFRATGSTIKTPGFMEVYLEGEDDLSHKTNHSDENSAAQTCPRSKEEEKILPELKEGDVVSLENIQGHQHFTEPPPRYREASLIKTLEEYGIGRPSTYATIISTIQNRGYVVVENKRFKPTDIGRVVSKFLQEYFTQYIDYLFTANLEDQLDEVARGEKPWLGLLKDFWQPFKNQVETINSSVSKKDVVQEMIDEKCPQCGQPLVIRLGKRGSFIGCTAYPNCRYTRDVHEHEKALESEEKNSPQSPETASLAVVDHSCPKCGGELQVKTGRFGKFIGCSNYPECKYLEPLEKATNINISCPECKKGSFLKKKTRYGKFFYSCSNYPKCKYAVWNEPLSENCPKCHWPILTLKISKKNGKEKVCPKEGCSFKEKIAEIEGNETQN